MAFETKELRGALFPNDKKDNAKQPDRTGTIKVNGVEYRISAWDEESKKGTPYLSLSLTHPDDLPKKGGQNAPSTTQHAPPSGATYDPDDDDIPF